jgi:hypothetical protein
MTETIRPGPALRRRGLGVWGLLAVVLALAGQLALGAVVPDAGAIRAELALRAALVECAPGTDGDRAPAGRHHADGLPCALTAAAALPAPLPTPAPVVPAPRGLLPVRLGRSAPLVSAAPRLPGAALPRGPPALG